MIRKFTVFLFVLLISPVVSLGQKPGWSQGLFATVNQSIVFADAYPGNTTAAQVQYAINTNRGPVVIVIPAYLSGAACDFSGIILNDATIMLEDQRGSQACYGFKNPVGTNILTSTNINSLGLTASQIYDLGMTPGDCVQVAAGGLLTSTGSACASGGGSGMAIGNVIGNSPVPGLTLLSDASSTLQQHLQRFNIEGYTGADFGVRAGKALAAAYAAGGGIVDLSGVVCPASCHIGTANLLVGDGVHYVSVIFPTGTVTRDTIAATGLSAQIQYNTNASLYLTGTTISGPSDVTAVQQAYGTASIQNAHIYGGTIADTGGIVAGSTPLQIGGPNTGIPLNPPPSVASIGYIGSWFLHAGSWFPGAIGELAIFNKALSGAQVAAEYTACNTAGVSCQPTIVADGPIAFWPLNDTTGTTAVDSVGGHNGTYTAGYSLASQSGIPGDAGSSFAVFNGSTGYVLLPSFTYFPAGDYTITGWAYTTTAAGLQKAILSVGTSLSNTIIVEDAQFSGLGFGEQVWTGGSLVPPSSAADQHFALPTNAWAQFAFVSKSGIISIYVNGALVAVGTDVGLSTFDEVTTSGADYGLILNSQNGCICYNDVGRSRFAGKSGGLLITNNSGQTGGTNQNKFDHDAFAGAIGIYDFGGGLNKFVQPDLENNKSVGGAILQAQATNQNGGSGFAVGDTVSVTQGSNTTAVLTVACVTSTAVGCQGRPGLAVTTAGTGYTTASKLTATALTGAGTGLKVDIGVGGAIYLQSTAENVDTPYEEQSGADFLCGVNNMVSGPTGAVYNPTVCFGSTVGSSGTTIYPPFSNFWFGPQSSPPSLGMRGGGYISFGSLGMYDTNYQYSFVPPANNGANVYTDGPVWTGLSGWVYGNYGHSDWWMGTAKPTSGIKAAGASSLVPIANPATPTLTPVGGTGTTSAAYSLVCNDGNGGTTLPAAPTMTVSGPAVLGAILTATVFNGGSGFVGGDVGSTLTIAGGDGAGRATIASVAGGAVTGVTLTVAGSQYNTVGPPGGPGRNDVRAATGGSGTGLTLQLTSAYIQVSLPQTDGCFSWTVLKVDTAHQLQQPVSGVTGSSALSQNIDDFGGATVAYTAAARNTTGDLSVKGNLNILGATSGTATLSATATGGTLNLGSTNAKVDTSGNMTVASCSGCSATSGTVTSSGSPVAGNIPKFTTATNIAPAAYSDVAALWAGGTCVGALQGNGTCTSASTPGLDTSVANITEEFCPGATTTLQIGSYGWTLLNLISGTATVTWTAGGWPHPCVLQLKTAAVSGDGAALGFTNSNIGLGVALASNGGWDSYWGFALGASSGIINRTGLIVANTTTIIPVYWMGVRFDPTTDSDTTFHTCVVTASTETTCFDTGVNADTAYHKVRIRSLVAGTILITFDSGPEKSFCSSSCDVTVTPNTGTAYTPESTVFSETTTTTELVNLDYFLFQATGLTR